MILATDALNGKEKPRDSPEGCTNSDPVRRTRNETSTSRCVELATQESSCSFRSATLCCVRFSNSLPCGCGHDFKELEIVVLRHELAIPRRTTQAVRIDGGRVPGSARANNTSMVAVTASVATPGHNIAGARPSPFTETY